MAATILVLFACFCTSISLEMRHGVVIFTGIMGAVLLGFLGYNTILSALAVTMYVVTGTRFYPENSSLLFFGLLTFIESFFFFIILVETGICIKQFMYANKVYAIACTKLFAVSVCCLVLCIFLTAVPIEIRIACLVLFGGLASIIFGAIGQENTYSAFAVAAYVTLGCVLAQSVSGHWTKPGELNSEIIALFSGSFFVSSLLIHASGVVKWIRARQCIAGREQLFRESNGIKECLYQHHIKFTLLSVILLLVVFSCGIFLFIESKYAQSGYIFILGGVGAIVLGSMKRSKFASAVLIALYITLGILMSTTSDYSFDLKYGVYALLILFFKSFFISTILIKIGLYNKNVFQYNGMAVMNAFKILFRALIILFILLCALKVIDIKIREIFFLAVCSCVAIIAGYFECKAVVSSALLSAYITAGMVLPRYISSRTAGKSEFDLATVRMFLLAFCFSLFMITVGFVLKRLVVAGRRRWTQMSQL